VELEITVMRTYVCAHVPCTLSPRQVAIAAVE
jgi:hypothetical protein